MFTEEKRRDIKSQQRYLLDEIRREQYRFHIGYDKSPYSWFKLCLYMEGAALVVYFLQGKIRANYVTWLYGILGVVGGVLLITSRPLLGLFIFYFKGILDSADGHLARIQNETSAYGKRLDSFCGMIGTLSFYLGVSIYIGYFTSCFAVPYVMFTFFLLKTLGVPMGRAKVIDSIIFSVGLHILVS